MKKLVKLFLGFFLVGVILTSCQEAKEILDVKFKADYQAEFDVVVTPSKGTNADINGVFAVSETIDPTSNPDFQLYIDKIQEISIREVKGEVLSISENVMLQSALISVTNENHIAQWEFTDEFITAGTVLTLDNDSGQWDAIENILLDKKVLTVSLSGEVDIEDVEFEIRFTLRSDVIANPLD